jgi:hypothetical protein
MWRFRFTDMGPYPRSRRAVIRPYKDMPPQLGPDGVFQRPAFTGNDRDAFARHRVSLRDDGRVIVISKSPRTASIFEGLTRR